MKYQYEYRSAFYPDENESFSSKEELRKHFRHVCPLVENFIEDDEIDVLQAICGPESHTLRRIYNDEV